MAGSPQFPKLRVGGDASRTQDNIAQQVAPIASAVRQTPMLDGTPPEWVALSLLNGFANIGTVNLANAARHKDSLGYIHLQGSINHAAGTAAGTVLATLPLGERPAAQQILPVQGTGATYQALLFSPNGNISVEVAVAAGGVLHLAGSFLADG